MSRVAYTKRSVSTCIMVETLPEIPHAFAKLVGLTVTERGEGHCKTELVVGEEHMNPNQVVHGAVIYALADTGMGGALTT
ncbi:MAG: PaaI family thioesterase, partial [Pseudomonadales bacterium]